MVIAAGRAGPTRVSLLAAAHPVRHGPPGGAAVSRHVGQQLARAELAKPIYHHPVVWTVRLGRWLVRTLNATGQALPGGWWALIALAVLLVIAVAAALAWIGPVARSRPRTRHPVLSGAQLSARDHRRNAERLAAAGDFAAAIIESVRAIALELEERSILPPRLGRTADELAAEASDPLPAQADQLRDAARLFDDVRYGDRAGTADGYQRLRDLDAAIRAARPTVSAAPPHPDASSAPNAMARPRTGAAAGPVP
jgi:Domain of unknown function (DUF4129)